MDFNGWEKLSLVDFDSNITTTLFTSGCPFRCPFCHNADLVFKSKELEVIPWDEIMAFLKKRQGILEAVCISGGEPTLGDDLLSKMAEIKKLGYKIKLDSNGFRPNVLKEAVSKRLIDYVAMDIKNSLARYGETIGVPSFDLAPIKESISFLLSDTVPYEFRTTIIEEFHSEKDIREMAELIRGAKRHFLQLYIDSENCIEHGFHAVSLEKARTFRDILASYVDYVALRGYEE